MSVDGIKVIINSTITPTPPMMNAGYPNNLFRAISDTPPSHSYD